MSARLPEQVEKYPPTRFMGSKRKLLPKIWEAASRFSFETVLDAFSGSGVVGYMFKAQGKSVTSNDHMAMSALFAKAMIENNGVTLSEDEAACLLRETPASDRFVATTFAGLYFPDRENALIDTIRANTAALRNPCKRAIATAALIRACLKKRPRGIFTYVGPRYDDGRLDLKKSFEEQFLGAVRSINGAVFDNGRRNRARLGDAMRMRARPFDLVYIDPPYYSPYSDNEYVRRYHFVEGIARNWHGVELQDHTKTKKFKSYPTPFSTRDGAHNALDRLFAKHAAGILIVSHSSNCLPTQEELRDMLSRHKTNVEVLPADHKYSLGNRTSTRSDRNRVQEYLFIGY